MENEFLIRLCVLGGSLVSISDMMVNSMVVLLVWLFVFVLIVCFKEVMDVCSVCNVLFDLFMIFFM